MQNSKKTICFPCVPSTIYCLLLLFLGCGNNRHAVIAVTGTNIGLEISQNPANQTPQAKLGYQRGEIAIVPTNRSAEKDPKVADGGAKDLGDVLMQFEFANIFSLRSLTGPSIRQLLAVGKNAVTSSGAAVMFAKDEKGTISQQATDAIESIESIRSTPPEIRTEKAKIARFYTANPDKQEEIKQAAIELGVWEDWNSFLMGNPREPSLKEIAGLKEKLGIK